MVANSPNMTASDAISYMRPNMQAAVWTVMALVLILCLAYGIYANFYSPNVPSSAFERAANDNVSKTVTGTGPQVGLTRGSGTSTGTMPGTGIATTSEALNRY